MECLISVAQGQMQGKVCYTPCEKKYYSFEGIPYAKPPVGELRFRDPQISDGWSGVLDATKPGNKCIQMNPFVGAVEGSEDCLYLNVYTPSLPREKVEKLPVLFFVHGGRFLLGYGDYYRPDYLIRNDVILVTINYRLNVFGFLCLHTPEVPGNAGLKDTVMALRWVKHNISHFNGDPSNIIAFGESAGAASVTSYLTSKMTNGMFSKIIAQSGSTLSDLFLIEYDPIAKAKELAAYIGTELNDLKDLHTFLLKCSADELIGAYVALELNRHFTIIDPFLGPIIEKEFQNVESFFNEYPLQAIRNNRFNNVPLILTLATHEAALFLHRDSSGNVMFNEDLRKYIPRYAFIDENSKKAFQIADRLKKLYFQDRAIGPSTLPQYLDMISDVYFLRDLIYTAELLSAYKENVFLCRFDYHGNMNTRVMKQLGIKGTTHGDLVQYVFYKDKKAKMCTDADRKVIGLLSEAWCNFAKTGKPTWTNQDVEWLPYKKNSKKCLNITDDGVECISLPEFQRLKVWFDLVCDRPKL